VIQANKKTMSLLKSLMTPLTPSKKSRKGPARGETLTVCLIGCGPAGMSFLQSARKKRTNGSITGVHMIVTCYERSIRPGGNWRDRNAKCLDTDETVMYGSLWSNIPKEMSEYHDYTFDNHFKGAAPSFLSRQDMLEYMLARNSRNGALDYVNYGHSVTDVTYNHSNGKFNVTVVVDSTGEIKHATYDRCVWAGGVNSIPVKPTELVDVLAEFEGQVLHSCEVDDASFPSYVANKNIMIVGDNASAEDLALLSVKNGANHVYVQSRSGMGAASLTSAWPNGRITVTKGPPYKCIRGNTFKCQPVYWSEKRRKYRRDDDEEAVRIREIATVILATGYQPCQDFLSEDLRFDYRGKWDIPKGWKMVNNSLTKDIGDVKPSDVINAKHVAYPDIYKGLLIKNPKMMFLLERPASDFGILDLDIAACIMSNFLLGVTPIPKEKEMVKANNKFLEASMNIPLLRASVDSAYAAEIVELGHDHWTKDYLDERTIALVEDLCAFKVHELARNLSECKYPLNLGKPGKLNAAGKSVLEMLDLVRNFRSSIKEGSNVTFRDCSKFSSLFTGTQASDFPSLWIDIPTTMKTVKF